MRITGQHSNTIGMHHEYDVVSIGIKLRCDGAMLETLGCAAALRL
jgi:hypothetical protein